MVERSLSMREVPGSIPGSSSQFFFLQLHYLLQCAKFTGNTWHTAVDNV